MNSPYFTISAIGAPLVEVIGDGPYTDRPAGLYVPDGVPVTDTVDLLDAWTRCWRVDAHPTTQVSVALTDSPYGAFVGVRRCDVVTPSRWWHRILVKRWPALWTAIEQTPGVPQLMTDDQTLCSWRDVAIGTWGHASARGGDVVAVTFVEP